MLKVQYTLLTSFIRAVDKIKSLRMVYQSSFNHPQIFLYGDNGLLTHWSRIDDFYRRHLITFKIFNNDYSNVVEELNKIEEQDLYDGTIDKQEYKGVVLSIVAYVESLELLVQDIFSSSTLLQFFNFTFQPDTLMYNLHLMYPNGVWDFIPEHSKLDLQEGAKSLIVGTPTAAAFMFLRALEGCMRGLCGFLDYKNPIDSLTFGVCIKFLEEYFKSESYEIKRQLTLFRYIKDEFRNPSAHPEKYFSQDEAEQLFQVVNVAINRICQLFMFEYNKREAQAETASSLNPEVENSLDC